MKETRAEKIARLEAIARKIRRNIIVSIGVGTAGHLGGACSSADIVAALYFEKMKFDPKNIHAPDRDRFLFSKGHAGIAQYAALAELGVFPLDDLKHTKEIGFHLQGHPDLLKTPGIEAGTGSLGQGLSIGLGMVLGNRLQGIDAKSYVIMGDGEITEGQIWEAAMAAAFYKADRLVGILDMNRLGSQGIISERFGMDPVADKWASFGWSVTEIDGHDMGQILDALDGADRFNGKPTLILAHTIKGKGVSFAENVVSFHNGELSREQYETALSELTV